MEKIIYTGLFLLLSSTIFAQADSSKLEQYCQVVATPRLLSNKVTIDIGFAEEKSFWRDTRHKTYSGKNYKVQYDHRCTELYGQRGIDFINAYPVRINATETFHFGFKKVFTKFEIEGL